MNKKKSFIIILIIFKLKVAFWNKEKRVLMRLLSYFKALTFDSFINVKFKIYNSSFITVIYNSKITL